MSQMSFNPFKINRISLLKQSGFNVLLKKVLVPKKKLDIYKSLLINNKNKEKKFDFHFIPIQITNENAKIKGNHSKINPLSEKNKIIRKHNILQKIDFNINSLKNNLNKNDEMNNNVSKFSNKISENSLNLPYIANSNKSINNALKRINNMKFLKNHNIQSYNDLLQYNLYSSSVKLFNDVKNYNNIFTNEKIKNTNIENSEKLKSIYADKGMQTNNSYIPNKEYNENNSNLKDKIIKSKDENDDSSSNDFEDIKEIENIISKSSRNMNNIRNNYDYHKFTYENSNKRKENISINKLKKINDNGNKKEFLILKNICLLNDNNINDIYDQSYKKSYTSRNIYFKNDNSLNNESNNKYNNKNVINENLSLYNKNEEKTIFLDVENI